jgi:hypothetical protein
VIHRSTVSLGRISSAPFGFMSRLWFNRGSNVVIGVLQAYTVRPVTRGDGQ